MRLIVPEVLHVYLVFVCWGYIPFSCSELQATSAQLSVNLAQANEAILAVASERDTLRTAVQEHEAEEESLKVQLQECDRKMSELKQVCDAQVR